MSPFTQSGSRLVRALIDPVSGLELLSAGTVLGEDHAALLRTLKPERVRFACLAPADLDGFEIEIDPLDELPKVARTGPRVLVVDDAAFMRGLLVRVLRAAGYEVEEAASGEQAVARAAQGDLDLVTLDVGMPGMDGLTALGELCRLVPEAKLLMVSAQGRPELIERARELGASEFLLKPILPTELVRAVERALGAPASRPQDP